MIWKQNNSLRARLRADMWASHYDLDRKVSQFDLATRCGFVHFLLMKSVALSSVIPIPRGGRSVIKEGINELLARVAKYLRVIGAMDDVETAEIGPFHVLAIDYLIAGSRLGTQLLRQRWLAAGDPNINQVSASFYSPGYIKVWKPFCAETNRTSAVGETADQIVTHGNLVFKFYHRCTHAPYATKGAANA